MTYRYEQHTGMVPSLQVRTSQCTDTTFRVLCTENNRTYASRGTETPMIQHEW